MRTTLAIDDDVLAAAKRIAEESGETVGEVISSLARQGLPMAGPAARMQRNGLSLLPSLPGAARVTPELVTGLSENLA